jgi:hypothetical protein
MCAHPLPPRPSCPSTPVRPPGIFAIDSLGRRATLLTLLALSGASSLGCAIAGPGLLQVVLATVNRGAPARTPRARR